MAGDRKNVLKPFEENKDYMQQRIKSGIENNRKGFAVLRFIDEAGNPVPDVCVKIKQKSHEFKYGANLFMLDEMESDEKNKLYKQYFKEAFNLATIPFYWRDLEPEEGKLRFSRNSPKIYRRPAPDLCLEFCEQNDITPKAHCLMYDQFSPKWLKNEVDEIKNKLDKRFRELSEGYAGRIHGWEVTNETLCQGRTVFFDEPDIVEWSFKRAEQYFPLNELIINEAGNNIWSVFKGNRSQYYMQIERALNKGVRIDTIGMQYHMFVRAEDEIERSTVLYDPVNIFKLLDRYADFKKPIQITELTIPCYARMPEDEEIQAEVIKNLYSIWFSHEAMESIIYWNLIDGYAYAADPGDMSAGENYYYGGLLRFDGEPKPAYKVIKKLFSEEWRTNETVRGGDNGLARFKGFYGEYDLEITHNEKTVNRSINLSKKGTRDFSIVL